MRPLEFRLGTVDASDASLSVMISGPFAEHARPRRAAAAALQDARLRPLALDDGIPRFLLGEQGSIESVENVSGGVAILGQCPGSFVPGEVFTFTNLEHFRFVQLGKPFVALLMDPRSRVTLGSVTSARNDILARAYDWNIKLLSRFSFRYYRNENEVFQAVHACIPDLLTAIQRYQSVMSLMQDHFHGRAEAVSCNQSLSVNCEFAVEDADEVEPELKAVLPKGSIRLQASINGRLDSLYVRPHFRSTLSKGRFVYPCEITLLGRNSLLKNGGYLLQKAGRPFEPLPRAK